MVSCLAKRLKYQLLQGETILELLYLLASLHSLDMFICCTGIRPLVEEQKVAGTVLADLIIPEIRLSVTTAVSSWGNFLPTNLPLTSPIGPFRSEMLR